MKGPLWIDPISKKSMMKNGVKNKSLQMSRKEDMKISKALEFNNLKIHFSKLMKWTVKFLPNLLSVKTLSLTKK